MSEPTPQEAVQDLLSSLHIVVRQRDDAQAQVSALQAVLIEARDELEAWRRYAQVRGMGAARTHAGLVARISEVLAQ